MKKKYRKNEDFEFYFDLSMLTKTSMNIYEKTVAQFINNDLFSLDNCRTNMFTQLGLVVVHSQFAERQILLYSFLFDSFSELNPSEVSSKLQDIISDEKLRLKAYTERENPFSQFREAIKYFNDSIPTDEKYLDLVEKTIKDRDYLIHRCVIDNPTLLYDREKIVELTKKAIYCKTLLTQIIYEANKYFMEAISDKCPEIAEKLIELIKSVSESINK